MHQIQSSAVSCLPGIDKIFSRIIINSNAQHSYSVYQFCKCSQTDFSRSPL